MEKPRKPKKPPSTLAFWGLAFTSVWYGTIMLILKWYGLGAFPFIRELRDLNAGTKHLILLGLLAIGIPKSMMTLLNTKKLLRSRNEPHTDKGEWARKAFAYASGCEILCVLGFASFLLGFHFAWAGAGLTVGTICKLCYAPVFMTLHRLAIEEAHTKTTPVARDKRPLG